MTDDEIEARAKQSARFMNIKPGDVDRWIEVMKAGLKELDRHQMVVSEVNRRLLQLVVFTPVDPDAGP